MNKVPRIIILSVILALICLGCGDSNMLAAEFDENILKSRVSELIEDFNDGRYDQIIEQGDSLFRESMTPELFEYSVSNYISNLGSFQSVERMIISGQKDIKGNDLALVVSVGAYANGKLVFLIGFNTDMELVQFYIQ